MTSSIVRIEKIELKNFKNVEKGVITFNDSWKKENYEPKSEIIGIYGQNGSGKTALVDACAFLKLILEGRELPDDAYNYINLFKDSATLKFDIYIDAIKEKYDVTYEFTLKKLKNKKVKISNEILSYSKKEKEWSTKVKIIEYDCENKLVLRPQKRYQELIKNNKDNLVNLKVAQELSLAKNTSFIFNNYSKNLFAKSFNSKDYIKIINFLEYFAICNLFVINNRNTGVININSLMPFSFRIEKDSQITAGNIGIALGGLTLIDKSKFEIVNKIIKQMNIVLKYIVPGMKIELYNYGEQHDEKGNRVVKVELLSIKGNLKLPIQYESEGIKKIISILSALISMYNNPSVCLVVDELDSGIYEFLLGEILKVIELGGKGQLIFTSHNLRPLEVLNKNSLYFTTTNANNRYIKFRNAKNNNNLRTSYIRSINLGGQKEVLYQETNNFDIRRALRMAGEAFNDL